MITSKFNWSSGCHRETQGQNLSAVMPEHQPTNHSTTWTIRGIRNAHAGAGVPSESTASRGTRTATGRVTRGVLQRLSSRDCQDSRNCCRAPATHSCRLGAVVLVSAAALPELEAPTQALGEAVAGPPPGLSAAASLGLRGGGEQQMADHRQVQPPASPRIFAAQGLRALLEFRIFHHAQSSGWPTTGRCNRLSLHPPREGWPEEGRGGAEERILGSRRGQLGLPAVGWASGVLTASARTLRPTGQGGPLTARSASTAWPVHLHTVASRNRCSQASPSVSRRHNASRCRKRTPG